MTPTTFFHKVTARIKTEAEFAYLAYKTKYDYNKRPAWGEMKPRPEGDFCDLAVVTFNNAEVVGYQIRTLRKFFSFPYRYTVFDNSNDEAKAQEIEAVCQRFDTGYIRLPRQEFLPKGRGSYSHGIACNYLFNKYIQFGGGKFFGLLDHDIFPVAPFDVSERLARQPFYGQRHYGFYLWPGYFFVRMDTTKAATLDFRPSNRLHGDTGACNAYHLFRGIDWSKYELATETRHYFDGQQDLFDGGYSLFDNAWVHCWNASNYMGKPNTARKMQLIYQMLEERLAENGAASV